MAFRRLSRWNSASEIEKIVRGELPIGSSPERVDQYLSYSGVEHSFDNASMTIYAIIRGIRGSFLASKSGSMKFHFGRNRRLDGVSFDTGYTFL